MHEYNLHLKFHRILNQNDTEFGLAFLISKFEERFKVVQNQKYKAMAPLKNSVENFPSIRENKRKFSVKPTVTNFFHYLFENCGVK